MTIEALIPLSIAVAVVLVVAMLCGAGLAAWRAWLNYKKLEFETVRMLADDTNAPIRDSGTGSLIELAAVKERLRRLEAIASGVEL